MAHELENMLWVGNDPPWHGLGKRLEDPPTSKEAIIAAGLDWEVGLKDIIIAADDDINIPTHKAVVRASDNSVLGVVGNRYRPIQNIEAFEFMDSLVEEGEMKYHTAGSLRGGQKVWLLGKVGSFEAIKDDLVDEYIFLWNSHDGKSCLRCMTTTVRVVCMNTARAALSAKGGFKLHHTSNLMSKIAEAKHVLGLSKKQFQEFQEFTSQIVKMQVNTAQLKDLTQVLIPNPPEDINPIRAEKERDRIIELFETGTGMDIPGVAGTGWAAFNAVTEYANFCRPSRGKNQQERRFESTLFGPSAKMINKTRQFLLAA